MGNKLSDSKYGRVVIRKYPETRRQIITDGKKHYKFKCELYPCYHTHWLFCNAHKTHTVYCEICHDKKLTFHDFNLTSTVESRIGEIEELIRLAQSAIKNTHWRYKNKIIAYTDKAKKNAEARLPRLNQRLKELLYIQKIVQHDT